ncbi:response regulator [Candidatus Uabimicrobium sp. HlEnr_7]|uniref:response regulator n=1 Tax=Candidatus Uabimicrobium helgolandensis TaxID=3095367 RepID=UPI0035578B22
MKKILIIEDQLNLIKLLKRVLEKKGYFVTACSDEHKGLSHFKEGKYDLLALDFNLRSISGQEIICQIKEKFPSFPILIMSGKANDFIQKNSYENICFMLKPFSISNFTKNIQQLLK